MKWHATIHNLTLSLIINVLNIYYLFGVQLLTTILLDMRWDTFLSATTYKYYSIDINHLSISIIMYYLYKMLYIYHIYYFISYLIAYNFFFYCILFKHCTNTMPAATASVFVRMLLRIFLKLFFHFFKFSYNLHQLSVKLLLLHSHIVFYVNTAHLSLNG